MVVCLIGEQEKKAEVLTAAQERARQMGKEAMEAKLRDIGLGRHEWDQCEPNDRLAKLLYLL
eukprot:SAG11_NODE_8018_length_1069_cov_1.239175_1_plen_61_part_10